MVFSVTAAVANDMLDDLGTVTNSGEIRFYTGSIPATADDAATGSLVATCPLNADAFGAAAEVGVTSEIAMLTASAVEDGDATGNASAVGYFRVTSSGGGTTYAQGDVTVTSGGGDIELSSTTITAGAIVTITSLTIALPQAGA